MTNKKTNKTRKSPSTGKRRKVALGKGLDALLPEMRPVNENSKDYFQCDIDLIRPNRFQPRRQFKEAELDELSQSIKEQGVIQPLLVRPAEHGYELIVGERRLRAARKANLIKVPVVMKDLSDAAILIISIVENIQRQNLNPIEEAHAYHRLMDEFDMTQEQVAQRVGKSRPAVANFLRLRQLPDQIKASILDETISMGHARALLGADTSSLQMAAWKTVISKKLSVRETEKLIKRLKKTPSKPKPSTLTPDEIHFRDLSENLSRNMGAKVQIVRRGQKGKVEIEFYGNDDLDRLITILNKASLTDSH